MIDLARRRAAFSRLIGERVAVRRRWVALAVAALAGGCSNADPNLLGGSATTTGSGSLLVPSVVSAEPNPEKPHEPGHATEGLLFDSSGRLVIPDSGTPEPVAMHGDGPIQAEGLAHEELPGVTIEAVFRPHHLPPPAHVPEAQPDGIAKAAKATELRSSIDLVSNGRMRWTFMSSALPFPFRTELRSRTDRYGHILLWPNEPKYRVLPPGSLRTALDEGRVDMTPLVPGTKSGSGAGKRLGEKTRSVTLESPLAKARLELASIPEASAGGPLLCRAVVELAGIDPSTSECKDDEVLLFASIDYQGGDGIDLEATAFTKRTDITPGDAVCPPPGAEYQSTGLPEAGAGIFVTKDDLGAFRSKPDPKAEPGKDAPGEGLLLENGRDQIMYYFLDGVPVASVPAESSRYVFGAPRGRYAGEWRTFLGDASEPPEEIVVPGKIQNVKTAPPADAGAP